MGKVIGILLIVIAVWLGMQYYVGESPRAGAEQAAASPAQRAGERVQDALDSGSERREALLPE
jgi:hypothetical protein